MFLAKTNLVTALVSCLIGMSVARPKPLHDFNVQIPANDTFSSSQITVPAGNISNIIVFGDSLSDNGNVFAASNNTYPSPPYYNGRWSNGPTWVEYVANAANASLYNYAFGGSEACNTFKHNGTVRPNLADQIDLFRNNANSSSLNTANDLYVVWIGANDYFNAATSPGQLFSGFPPKVVECVSNGINTILNDFQPKRLLVLDIPPLGATPVARNYSEAAQWFGNQITEWHNSELKKAVQKIQQNNQNTSFTLVDTPKIFNNATANAQQYNIADTTDSCFVANETNVCSDPNSYLFWDEVHPTTHTHKILASLITDFDPANDALQSGSNSTDGNNIGNWFTSVAATGGVASFVAEQQQRAGPSIGNITNLLSLGGNSTSGIAYGVKGWIAGKQNSSTNSVTNWIKQNANGNSTNSIKNLINGAASNGTGGIQNLVSGNSTNAIKKVLGGAGGAAAAAGALGGNTTAKVQQWVQNQSKGASNSTNNIKNWVQNAVQQNTNKDNSTGATTISTAGAKNWVQGQQQNANTSNVGKWVQQAQQGTSKVNNNATQGASNAIRKALGGQ